MRAMILAAGRGERLRPLTDHTPKPLLPVHGKPLIVYHLEALQRIGIQEVVINVSYLAEQIQKALGDGSAWGMKIHYSLERDGVLETGGGIQQARPLLKDEPFLLMSADIFTDYPLDRLTERDPTQSHIVLVNNPPHHPSGDFALQGDRVVSSTMASPSYTYGNIGIFHPQLFNKRARRYPLREVLVELIDSGQLFGSYYSGKWTDVGTKERLDSINQRLLARVNASNAKKPA